MLHSPPRCPALPARRTSSRPAPIREIRTVSSSTNKRSCYTLPLPVQLPQPGAPLRVLHQSESFKQSHPPPIRDYVTLLLTVQLPQPGAPLDVLHQSDSLKQSQPAPIRDHVTLSSSLSTSVQLPQPGAPLRVQSESLSLNQ